MLSHRASSTRWIVAAVAVLTIVLLAGLTACGGDDSDSEGAGTDTAATEDTTSQETVRMGLVLTDLTVSTINEIKIGAEQRAEELGNVEVVQGGSSDTVEWLNACQRIISAGIDVLAYSTIDAEGTRSCIVEANNNGIPLICVLPCTPLGDRNASFELDFHANGATIGRWMGSELGDEGDVAIIVGAPGDQAAAQLVQGFKDGLAEECGGCEVVAEAPGGFNRSQAFDSAQRVLSANPSLRGIYSLNDDGALGVVRAAQQQGKLGELLIAGHNGACEALENILNDRGLSFTVLLAGEPLGIAAVDTAVKFAKGEDVPDTVSGIKASIGIDNEVAQGYLSGDEPNPEGVDVQSKLQKIEQDGC